MLFWGGNACLPGGLTELWQASAGRSFPSGTDLASAYLNFIVIVGSPGWGSVLESYPSYLTPLPAPGILMNKAC